MGVGKGCKDFENFINKYGYFLSFEWDKPNFTDFVLRRKILEKCSIGPPGKNLSHAHGSNFVF